ncbi:iron transporter [Haloarcula mannanilytica]|uniref:Iron transporter n=1 Tax=Haloarcula mannanilytica TaxID=2509225 RepID=A0A4C2EMS6_9EURY|nr:IucA/IucC family siderophore biosynthesis protein [Haloarcula mannanilytica]GCF15888.1 iron transporter [Haloarcula mannanilytica]
MTEQLPGSHGQTRGPATLAAIREAVDGDTWETVNREMVAKAIAELLYEGLLAPEPIWASDGRVQYRLVVGETTYRFEATPRRFDSYYVDPASVERSVAGEEWVLAVDAVRFLRELGSNLDIEGMTVSKLIREHVNTLLVDAHVRTRRENRESPPNPTELSYANLDAELDGHPWITYSKGRLGFGYEDHHRYAPEQQPSLRLYWLAARRTQTTAETVSGTDYESFVSSELGTRRAGRFGEMLTERGFDPENYRLLPVHEWQWHNTVATFFADEIAADRLVPLEAGPPVYQPLQSVRTLVNTTDPAAHDVKLPLRMLNTLIYRGIPGERVRLAPQVTDALWKIRNGDSFLADEHEFLLPGEVASIDYDHPVYDEIDGTPYQYQEMLCAIWRESITECINESEQAIPLSALLYEHEGTTMLGEFAAAAGVGVDQWLGDLFDVLLPPLLHFLYQYGVGFSPHGEDAIIVIEDGLPVRAGVKDFIDLTLTETPRPEQSPFSPECWDALVTKPLSRMRQCLVASLFVCVFRYLADLVARQHGYDEDRFWRQVRERIIAYQTRFPELTDRFEECDLLAPSFKKICLNRNRLTEYGYRDTAQRPSITVDGRVSNALSEVARDQES